MKATVHGVGINDLIGKYPIKFSECYVYKTWKKMLGRCYDPKYQALRPTYVGSVVCDEWLWFSKFKSWMETQDFEGKCLDKDLLSKGEKVYSPETCVFLPNEVNVLLISGNKEGKAAPSGVSYQESSKKYIVSCAINGKNKNLGRFECPKEAFVVYKTFKEALIKQFAEDWKGSICNRAYEGLINFKIKE